MRAAWAVLVVGGLLLVAGCGSPSAVAEMPAQVLAASAQKMLEVKYAKFDVTVTAHEDIPPDLNQTLIQAGDPGTVVQSTASDEHGSGDVQLTARLRVSFSFRFGSQTIQTETITVEGNTYFKDPQSSTWISNVDGAGLEILSRGVDPAMSPDLLKLASSIKDLGDTQLNGAAVHHYQFTANKNGLAELFVREYRDPSSEPLRREVGLQGTLVAEVWIGNTDRLLHRITQDLDVSVRAADIASAYGRQVHFPVTSNLNAAIHMTSHSVFDFHDFSTPLTIATPSPVSPY